MAVSLCAWRPKVARAAWPRPGGRALDGERDGAAALANGVLAPQLVEGLAHLVVAHVGALLQDGAVQAGDGHGARSGVAQLVEERGGELVDPARL
jgi:hypothetical protein